MRYPITNAILDTDIAFQGGTVITVTLSDRQNIIANM